MAPKPKEESPKRFIALLTKTMRQKGLSLRSVARKANLDPSAFSKILTGQQGLPSDTVIRNLARAIGLDSPAELFVAARRVPKDKYYSELFRATSLLNDTDKVKVLIFAKKLAGIHGKNK